MADELIQSLTAAVEAAPQDVTLRVHLAELLLAAGRTDDCVRHAAAALAVDPSSASARGLMARATGGPAAATETPGPGTREGFDWASAEAELGAPKGAGSSA